MKIIENVTELITNWFKSDRDYESGKQLYIKHGRSLSFKTQLNRVGFSKANYDYLCYELAKIVGITEPAYKAMLNKPLVSTQATSEEDSKSGKIVELTIDQMAEQLELVNITDLEWPQIQKLCSILKLKPEGKKKEHKIAALVSAKMKKLQSTVPDNIKRSIKLREEFPFLKEKTCPGVLKELVSELEKIDQN